MFSTCNVHNIRLGLPRIPPPTHSHLPCICPSSPPAGDLRGVLDCITEGHRAFAPSPPLPPCRGPAGCARLHHRGPQCPRGHLDAEPAGPDRVRGEGSAWGREGRGWGGGGDSGVDGKMRCTAAWGSVFMGRGALLASRVAHFCHTVRSTLSTPSQFSHYPSPLIGLRTHHRSPPPLPRINPFFLETQKGHTNTPSPFLHHRPSPLCIIASSSPSDHSAVPGGSERQYQGVQAARGERSKS